MSKSLAFSEFMTICGQRVDTALQTLLNRPQAPSTIYTTAAQKATVCSASAQHLTDVYAEKSSQTGINDTLQAAMQYSLFNGGKRIRPVLAYASAAAVSTANCASLSPKSDALMYSTADSPVTDLDKIACALECIHAYSLIHDDLPAMDDDDLRRGKPTCHIQFNEAIAILAGDALQSLAFEQLSQLQQTPPQTALQLLQCLTDAAGARGMVSGQAIDLQAVGQQLEVEALEHMHRLKTGALIRASVLMGALVVGANDSQLRALDNYAQAIGLAFQVQDDILDVVSDTTTLGKRQGADAANSKPTYVSLLGLDNAVAKAKQLHRNALAALAIFDDSANRLQALADYIVQRNY